MAEHKQADAAPEEDRYPRDFHLEAAQGLYGVPRSALAGALASLDARKKSFTVSEVEAAVKAFMDAEV